MPALPILLLVNLRYICVIYVTTVLVRHWAGLYQKMGKNHQGHGQGQLTERIAREFFLCWWSSRVGRRVCVLCAECFVWLERLSISKNTAGNAAL